MTTVRTRIAPSPTGNAHIGTARSALVNYAFAKKHGGQFILRIDDTDQARSTAESEKGVFEALRWLGLDWDEGADVGGDCAPYRQSEKLDRYKTLANQLIEQGKAYRCFCPPKEKEQSPDKQDEFKIYDRRCLQLPKEEIEKNLNEGKPYSVRLIVEPDEIIRFKDLIHGDASRNSSTIGDFIILRSDGFPVYQFATVADEIDMKISHVLRGQEHFDNTFKQLLIFRALGCPAPEYGHLGLLLNKNKAKISKRDGAVYIGEYRDLGYLPEAILNFLSLLGWSMPDGNELFTLNQFIENFDLSRFSKVNCIFETMKLDFMNAHYIKQKSPSELLDVSKQFLVKDGIIAEDEIETQRPRLERALQLVQEKVKFLREIPEKIRFFFKEVEPDYTAFATNKALKSLDKDFIKNAVANLYAFLDKAEPWKTHNLEELLRQYIESNSLDLKVTLMLTRTCCLGSPVTPALFESMELLGKEKCLGNVKKVLNHLD